METLFAAGLIRQRDVHSVYEALFLRSVTGFEIFLEDLFISIMTGHTTYPAARGVVLKMSAMSTSALLDILRQGDNYMDWIPIGKTVDRAKIYLKDGKPFSDLTMGDRSQIKTIATIRNSIAHHSKHAKNEFRRTVLAGRTLLPVEKTPAGFLRAQARATPKLSFFQVYAGELVRIARFLG
jgi:hypothetical protein